MLFVLILSQLVAAATASQRGDATATTSLPLVVGLFDYASVPASELQRAREEVSRIFGEIGVEIAWWESRDPALMPSRSLVVIVARDPATRQHLGDTVMGVTAGTAGNRGSVAYVFYDRVDQRRLRRGEILGCFIAHEVGHLLLPFLTHSRDGLMRARWDARDLELAESGRLRFAPQQGEQIRANVIERSRTATDR